MDSRNALLSAFRGFRVNAQPPRVQEVGGPVGARSNMTAMDQAEMIRNGAPRKREDDDQPATALGALPKETRGALQTGYGKGGFEGVVNTAGTDWYDLPQEYRTKLLANLAGSE